MVSFGQESQNVRHIETATVYLITDRNEKIAIDVLIVPTIAVPLSNIQREVKTLKYLCGLKLAHPVTDEDGFEISLLIGADSFWKIVQNRVIRGKGPTAVQSKIGYLLSGPMPINKENNKVAQHMMNVFTSPPNPLDLERFWKLESLGITPEEEAGDPSDLKLYMDTCVSFSEGKYIAKLPWKEDHPPLPTNYAVALRRTETMIRRLRKEPCLFDKYGEIISEQIKRGFIEEVNDSSVPNHQVHYIPHHGVKKDSVTTPIRIVYDCSCRQSTDKPSLNDCLKSTPPELNDLAGILIRFRLNKYAITTDIEKAFLHVSLHEKDPDVTRFLWLKVPSNPESSMTTYRFKAVLFGATCSPFILCTTIIKHLENNRDNWVSTHLLRDIYVDNIISSFPTESDVTDFYRDTRTMMAAANFNLRSWNSNCKSVREAAKSDQILDKDKFSKILGLRWDAINDVISFPERMIPISDLIMKREVLKHTARLYDPLGLLIPVTIRAKIMLQEIWQKKYSWDIPLPCDIHRRWYEIARDINCVSSEVFDRYLLKNDVTGNFATCTDETTLHVFVDASMAAYGAAVYICRGNKSALVMSKTRVAPLKGLTLPQLELMAAVIGARLVRHLLKEVTVSKVEL